jgi:hypothetical protein
VVSPDKGAA